MIGKLSGKVAKEELPHIISKEELPNGNRFEGYRYGDVNVSFFLVDTPPDSGPVLHTHPYEEIFVVQEGSATFTAGDEIIEAGGGQVVVVPAGVPHRFVNSGVGRLRQVDRHASERFITEWLEE